eukprot:COSAG01_NODE_2022_length_8630_cov_16.836010_4_plen_51_part_00
MAESGGVVSLQLVECERHTPHVLGPSCSGSRGYSLKAVYSPYEYERRAYT